MCNEIKGSYDYHHSTKLYQKKFTHLLPLALLLVLHYIGNKLVIFFFGIASYYGDNHIATICVSIQYTSLLCLYTLFTENLHDVQPSLHQTEYSLLSQGRCGKMACPGDTNVVFYEVGSFTPTISTSIY